MGSRRPHYRPGKKPSMRRTAKEWHFLIDLLDNSTVCCVFHLKCFLDPCTFWSPLACASSRQVVASSHKNLGFGQAVK